MAIAFTVIPHVLERFAEEYPRVIVYFDEVASASATRDFRDLRDRKYDLILGRGGALQDEERLSDDLNIETLFDDGLVIAAGANSKWAARRHKIALAELVDELWIMQPHSWNHRVLLDVCRASGLALPKATLVTLSMSVITHFLAGGRYITAMPRSVAYFKSLCRSGPKSVVRLSSTPGWRVVLSKPRTTLSPSACNGC
jgi:DNA-binding transcriptional LysR family regulator